MCGRFTASMSKTSPSRYPLWVKQPSCTGCVKNFSLCLFLSLFLCSLSLSLSRSLALSRSRALSLSLSLALALSPSISLSPQRKTCMHQFRLVGAPFVFFVCLALPHSLPFFCSLSLSISFVCLALPHSLPFFLSLSLSISQVRLVGASFALNQIRKMMGMALAGVCLHVCCMYVGIHVSARDACMPLLPTRCECVCMHERPCHACLPLLPTRCACVCIHQRRPTSNLETNWSSAPRVPGGAVPEAVRSARTAHIH